MDVLPARRRGSPPRAALVHTLCGSAVDLLTAVPAARAPLTRTASELVRERVARR